MTPPPTDIATNARSPRTRRVPAPNRLSDSDRALFAAATLDAKSARAALDQNCQQIRTEAISVAKTSGRQKAEIDFAPIDRSRRQAPSQDGAAGHPATHSPNTSGVAARFRQLEVEVETLISEGSGALNERLRVVNRDRLEFDNDLVEARANLSEAKAEARQQRGQSALLRSQSIEFELSNARIELEDLRDRRTRALREVEVLEVRIKTLDQLKNDVAARIEAASHDVEKACEQAWSVGYSTRQHELLVATPEVDDSKSRRRKRIIRIVAIATAAIAIALTGLVIAGVALGDKQPSSTNSSITSEPSPVGKANQ